MSSSTVSNSPFANLKPLHVPESQEAAQYTKLDPGSRLALERYPAGVFAGLLRSTLSAADLQKLAGSFGIHIEAVIGPVATFRAASKAALLELATSADVKSIQGVVLQSQLGKGGPISFPG